eukprot:11203647-Lingulodinium_polyedra.AAC.1
MDDALKPEAWRKAEDEFAEKAFLALELRQEPQEDPEDDDAKGLEKEEADISLEERERQHRAKEWAVEERAVHFVVDSLTVAQWAAGVAEVDDRSYQQPVAWVINTLVTLVGSPSSPRMLREAIAEPVEWFRRCWNRAADKLA